MPPEQILQTVVFAAVGVAALALLAFLLARFRPRKRRAFKGATEEWTAPDYVYNLKTSPMTAAENRFYFLLCAVLPERFVVVPQMPLTAVVERPGQGAAVNKIDRKSVDFGVFRVVKKGGDRFLRPAFLIELDDETHALSYREERDRFVNGLCRQIGLPLVRAVGVEYDERAVEKLVKPYTGR